MRGNFRSAKKFMIVEARWWGYNIIVGSLTVLLASLVGNASQSIAYSTHNLPAWHLRKSLTFPHLLTRFETNLNHNPTQPNSRKIKCHHFTEAREKKKSRLYTSRALRSRNKTSRRLPSDIIGLFFYSQLIRHYLTSLPKSQG